MKKYAIFLLYFICLPLWAFSEQDLIAHLQQSKTVQGDFIQQHFLKDLPQPIETKGKFSLVTAKGLLWHMQTPFEVQLRITPQGIQQWNGQQWVANHNLAQSQQIRLFLGLLSGELSAVKSHFNLQLSGTAQHWTLQLVPQSTLMKQIFTSIILQGQQTVTTMQLNETQGDSTTIKFEKIQINQPLSKENQQALE